MNKFLDGKTFPPLSMQKQIVEMRSEIESNAQHSGQKFELVKAAFDEIKEAHGGMKSKYKSSCSACVLQINSTLKNWLKLYDAQGASDKRIAVAPEFKPLKPVSKEAGPNAPEPTYKELLTRFNDEATAEQKEAILAGRKTPKKDELIAFFNGK